MDERTSRAFDTSEGEAPTPTSTCVVAVAPPLRTSLKPVILLVSDDPSLGTKFRTVLTASPFHLIVARSALLALEIFENEHPDAVLVDCSLLDEDGKTVCERLSTAPRGRPAPIVVIAEDESVIPLGYSLGATDFLVPPFSAGSLIPHLRYILRAGQAMRSSRETEVRLRRSQRIAKVGYWELSLETGDLVCDDETCRILSLSFGRGPSIVESIVERIHPDDRTRVLGAFTSRRPHRLEYRVIDPANPALPRVVQHDGWLDQDEANGEVRLLGTVHDITQLTEANRRIARLAYYDQLTGLPNRAFLREHLSRVLSRAQRANEHCALLMLDLDLFKRVNDTMGHGAGDVVLKEVGRRLSEAVRDSDSVIRIEPTQVPVGSGAAAVARIGGDEFIVVLGQVRAPEDAAIVARRIRDALVAPIALGSKEVFIGCSIGIAIFPENGEDSDLLIKHADTALYQAKDMGRNNYQFFSPSINERAERRMFIETGLRTALAKNEFELHYQPQLRPVTGEVVGVEALIRWPQKTGFIGPDQFIPVAEDCGLIVPIGDWVLRTACEQARAWRDLGIAPFQIAVNVSARQLIDKNYPDRVKEILEATQQPPELLELELTESVLIRDNELTVDVLQRLKALGVRLALDDFGTGSSSLAHLRLFPIDTLKIDRSFVKNIDDRQSTERAIAAAIVALSRSLSLRSVAEGVETDVQARCLTELGCTELQGYLYARPMPSKALIEWLAARRGG